MYEGISSTCAESYHVMGVRLLELNNYRVRQLLKIDLTRRCLSRNVDGNASRFKRYHNF